MYVLIDLRTQGPVAAEWLASLPARPDRPSGIQRFPSIGYAALEVTAAEFATARGRGLSIDPVRELRPLQTQIAGRSVLVADFLGQLPDLWHLEQIGRSALSATGKGIKVGHIDTGIESRHPVLSGHPAKFTTFKQNGDVVAVGHRVDPFDEFNHGTGTASLICGKPLGVAPDVQLFSAALLGRPWTDAMLVAALDWMIVEGVSVVWLGVERPAEFCDFHEKQMQRLVDAKILPVTAVGNKGKDTSSTPGNTIASLSVGAIGKGAGSPILWGASGSQVHPSSDALRPDLVAPGHDVHVATYFSGAEQIEYEVTPLSGTSLAGPHLVGLAALCLELRPKLTVAQLVDIFKSSCLLYSLDPKRVNHGVPKGERIKAKLP